MLTRSERNAHKSDIFYCPQICCIMNVLHPDFAKELKELKEQNVTIESQNQIKFYINNYMYNIHINLIIKVL